MKKKLLLLLAIFLFNECFSQVNTPLEFPPSFGDTLLRSMQAINSFNLPNRSNTILLTEDLQKPSESPLRMAVLQDVDLNIKQHGMYDTLSNGDKIWRLKINSTSAIAMNFLFDSLFLSSEAQFFIYSTDQSKIVGPFTFDDVRPSGQFASPHILGESIVLELYEPKNTIVSSIVHIFKISHAYRNLQGNVNLKSPCASGNCNDGVNCPQGIGWDDQKRSVVRLIMVNLNSNEEFYGSGVMVNNTSLDGTPYLLTVFHNLDNDTDPGNCFLSQ